MDCLVIQDTRSTTASHFELRACLSDASVVYYRFSCDDAVRGTDKAEVIGPSVPASAARDREAAGGQ